MKFQDALAKLRKNPEFEREYQKLKGERKMKKCLECEAVVLEGDEGPALYECGDCGIKFNRDGSYNDNHQCPDCRKFSMKLADESCPECGQGELEDVVACTDCGLDEATSECDLCGNLLCDTCANEYGGLCVSCAEDEEEQARLEQEEDDEADRIAEEEELAEEELAEEREREEAEAEREAEEDESFGEPVDEDGAEVEVK